MAEGRKEKGKDIKEQEVLLTFLRRAKNGEYAPVEEGSLEYTRIDEEAETIVLDEEYYYSMS